jgi:hypothetical protein
LFVIWPYHLGDFLGWLWITIFLVSASWVAGITGVSHWYLACFGVFKHPKSQLSVNIMQGCLCFMSFNFFSLMKVHWRFSEGIGQKGGYL